MASAVAEIAGLFAPAGRRWRLLWAGLLLFAAALLLFGRTLGYDWSYDDFVVIVTNPDVTSWSGFLENTFPGRPLRELSYLFDHALFGLQPGWWHLQSIVWHACNATLAGVLAQRLGLASKACWGVALLLLLHPLNVEVVANLSHRKDLLALTFCLLALLAYLQAFTGERRRIWLTSALLLWGVGLLAKQNALLLLPVLICWEAGWLPDGERLLWRRPRLACAGLGIALLAGAIWLLVDGIALYREQAYLFLTRWHYYGADAAWLYPLMVLKSWAFTGSRLFWPWPLAVEYHYPVPTTPFDPWVLAGALLFGAWLAALVLAWRRRLRLVCFGLVWFGLFWLPTSNLWPLAYFAADRYFYLPALGLFLALAAVLDCESRRWQGFAFAALLTAFATLTAIQIPVWKDDETLYRHALAVSPQSAFICNELGKLYQNRGEPATALQYYLRGAKADPGEASLPFNLGTLYESLGFREQALEYYRQFFRLEHPGEYAAVAEQLRERLQRQYGVTFGTEPP